MATPPLSIGRFQVTRVLGRSASHMVYLASDPKTWGQVALKTALPGSDGTALAESFQREWETTLRLRHPGVRRVLELEHDEAFGPYLVLEYQEGLPLGALLQDGLPPFTALHLLIQLMHVLESAAREGILHGDLKPDNLWVDPRGTLKLMDFGASRNLASRLGPGPAVGSPGYTAPELLRGELPSPKSELFSFAATAFQTLTGRLPFPGPKDGEAAAAGDWSDPVFPEDMPEVMQRVFAKALDRDPEQRFSNLHDFMGVLIAASPLEEDRLDALLAFLDGRPVPLEGVEALMARRHAPSPRATRPIQPTPAEDPAPPSAPPPPAPAPETLRRLLRQLEGLPGVAEVVVQQGATVVSASAHRHVLGSFEPAPVLDLAAGLPDPGGNVPVRSVLFRSPKRVQVLSLRKGHLAIAFALRPGASPASVLEALAGLDLPEA